jgi:hypothetical protein
MTDINATLAERGNRYGRFRDHAFIAQGLKKMMWGTPGWQRLADDQKQALEVIGDKIARILNGDPDYTDNWHDIIGYAKLVEDRLVEQTPVPMQATDPETYHGEIPESEWRAIDPTAWDHLPPSADADPQSVIVQRSRIRQVIDDFWKNRSSVAED